jgi:hypothetical protein
MCFKICIVQEFIKNMYIAAEISPGNKQYNLIYLYVELLIHA